MGVKIIIVLITYLSIAKAVFTTGHEDIVARFRESAKGLESTAVETKWIKQPLDHFNKTDTREWKMKYFENLDKWRARGPMYFYINGEGPATSHSLLIGLLYELAVETKGAMWATEHRYYGDSQPFEHVTTDNLKYLSSRQALADIAKLIEEKKRSSNFTSAKVVVVGGSYSGNLAAWMRLLYPNLVDAAVSSSAPVLAKTNFFEYLETVGIDLKKYATPQCFEQIITKFDGLKRLMKTKKGIERLKIEANICNEVDMTIQDNQALLFFIEMSCFSKMAQYGSTKCLKDVCNSTCYLDVFNFNRLVKTGENRGCFPLGVEAVCGTETKPWLYQMCTEFGYYTTSPKNQPFANTLLDENLFYQICSTCLGPEFNQKTIEEGVKKTNEMYGGLNPKVSNVIFVNGEIDPWHRLGVLKDISDTVPARLIPGASHCNDLHYWSEGHEEVKKVQKEEKELIKKWIGV